MKTQMIEAKLILEIYDNTTGEQLGWIHRWNNGDITASIDELKTRISFRDVRHSQERDAGK